MKLSNNIKLHTSFKILLKYITDELSAGEFRDIKCSNVHVGRFVAVHLVGPGILTVCELEVYGGKSVFDFLFDCPHFGKNVYNRV